MNLLQPVQILQTGMKAMFDLDPTITEQLYHHGISQLTLVTALSVQLIRAIISRLPRQIEKTGNTFRLSYLSR